jgi:hypothetical protein
MTGARRSCIKAVVDDQAEPYVASSSMSLNLKPGLHGGMHTHEEAAQV